MIGELDAVHLLLRFLASARTASTRGVYVAAAGSVAGAGLALLGPATAAVARANLARDCTALAALASGEWAGWNVGREAPPVPADHTPWHAMAVRDVLDRLRTSPNGLTEPEAALRRTARQAAAEPVSLIRASLEDLVNPLTPVLAAGAGLSAAFGSVLDAALISTVTAVGGLLGGAQRGRGPGAAPSHRDHRRPGTAAPPHRRRGGRRRRPGARGRDRAEGRGRRTGRRAPDPGGRAGGR
ncbi:cation-transporting P-type ATPase [Nonomuraea antimicrobica]